MIKMNVSVVTVNKGTIKFKGCDILKIFVDFHHVNRGMKLDGTGYKRPANDPRSNFNEQKLVNLLSQLSFFIPNLFPPNGKKANYHKAGDAKRYELNLHDDTGNKYRVVVEHAPSIPDTLIVVTVH